MSESENIVSHVGDDPNSAFLTERRFPAPTEVSDYPEDWISGTGSAFGTTGKPFTKAEIRTWQFDLLEVKKRNRVLVGKSHGYPHPPYVWKLTTSSGVAKHAHLLARAFARRLQAQGPAWPVREESYRVLQRIRAENQRLKTLVRILMGRVREYQKWNSAQGVISQTKLPAISTYDSSIAAAEMLAASDEEDKATIISILEKTHFRVSDLVERAGTEDAVRLANYLGNCRAVIVHDDFLVRTDFGKTLAERIQAATNADESEDGREDPS